MSFHLLMNALPLVTTQQISIAALVALLMSTLALPELWLPLASFYRHVADSAMAKQRLNQYQSSPEHQLPLVNDGILQLELQQLSARQYGAINSTQAISLHLKAGDLLWLQGASGAGKSTLLATIAGWLAPASGQIVLNGTPLQRYPVQQQRQRIGLLSQHVTLFNMSLAANLRLAAPDATDQQLIEALTQAQLADWLATLPLGLATELGEYGTAVSGGQARRIALAQMLLLNSSILLLDEPLVGLDSSTAQELIRTLRQRCQQQILIIASHQPLHTDATSHQLQLKLL
jgi:ATP-binding cassette, subfamily C, bacterial CydC